MITILNLSKNYDKRMLLDKVTFSIFRNEKIGLAGPNGAGKTTLFHILMGNVEPGEGEVQRQKNIKIGYLPQESHFESDRTVIQELTSGDEQMAALMKEKKELEDTNQADNMRYGDVMHELEVMGYYQLETKAEKILSGLGFKQHEFHKPVVQLSGGWQMRTLLAKLLTYEYDLLLLDEPTNYLDLGATLWLKDFLSAYQGAFVIISHDKVFLNDVTNYTVILEDGKIAKVKGNYEAYEQMKAMEFKTLEKKQKVLDKRREQLERFAQRFHAQPNRASAVRNKRKMIERLEVVELPDEKRSIRDFTIPPTRSSGYVVLNVEHICKSYGDKQVYKDLNLEIIRNQKVCLVGQNGAGKSTLLKMLAGVLDFDSGERKLGFQVDMGYFSQTRLDVLNPDKTALEEVMASASGSVPAVQVRTLLGLFNFRGDDVFKQVKVLSGGEKSRLILAKLLINPPNFILLDEPTTHLDIDGVEALTHAFKEYQGTLCFISHDLYFVKEIANHIIEVDNGQLRAFPGDLQYYLDKKGQEAPGHLKQERKPKGAENQQVSESQAARVKGKEAFKDMQRKHKEALNRIDKIKEEIRILEKEKKDLETESYIKARILADGFSKRNPEELKESGQRLKYIPRRVREIEMAIDRLIEERNNITK